MGEMQRCNPASRRRITDVPLHRRRQPWVEAYFLLILALCGLTVWVTLRLDASGLPKQIDTHVSTTYRVRSQPYDDPQFVKLSFTRPEVQPLRAPTGGLVTASNCQPGQTIGNGTETVEIDGRPILNLATKHPITGVISPSSGTRRDIADIQNALTQMNLHSGRPGRFDAATRNAVRAAFTRIGYRWHGTLLKPSMFAWVDDSRSTVAICVAQLGATVSSGANILTLSSVANAVNLTKLPRTAVQGQRNLNLAGTLFSMPQNGTSTNKRLITKVSILSERGGIKGALTGTTFLSHPVQAFSVPTQAIIGDSHQACVISGDGDVVHVRVLSSSLGSAMIEADSGPRSLNINLSPAASDSC